MLVWLSWAQLTGWVKSRECAEDRGYTSECFERLDKPTWTSPVAGLGSDPIGPDITVMWALGTTVCTIVLVALIVVAARLTARHR